MTSLSARDRECFGSQSDLSELERACASSSANLVRESRRRSSRDAEYDDDEDEKQDLHVKSLSARDRECFGSQNNLSELEHACCSSSIILPKRRRSSRDAEYDED